VPIVVGSGRARVTASRVQARPLSLGAAEVIGPSNCPDATKAGVAESSEYCYCYRFRYSISSSITFVSSIATTGAAGKASPRAVAYLRVSPIDQDIEKNKADIITD
jgi:hypothetical protein